MGQGLIPQRMCAGLATVLLVFGLAGCSDEGASEAAVTSVAQATPKAQEEAAGDQTSATPVDGEDLDGDVSDESDGYAFGTDRDDMAQVFEQTYGSRNAKARWEGDVFILSLDGDGEELNAGFSECRVATQMLNDGDEVVIEFPNARIDCSEVLADD